MTRVMIVCSLICFVLAVFNVGVGVNLIALGLAFNASSKLI